MNMLEINNIDVYYGDLQALRNISLTVNDGEIVALVGSNGAGKSTIVKTITGLLKPRSGSISYDGIRLDKLPAHKIVELGISMIPEGRRLFPQMSVLENLEMGAFTRRARKVKDQTIGQVYQMFPILKDRAGQAVGTLSGGEQQMVVIGRALMSQPKLLLVDEMSLGLAPLLVSNFYQLIGQLNKTGVTFLLVEQNVRIALAMANRGYIIENSRIVDQGDTGVLLNSEQVKHAYLGIGEQMNL
jgi:branched-chain amino acid transport system ATP-binding protein